MYVIEHALLNILKNKGRNILLGVIIFAIITATVVALAIYNTSGYIIGETRTALQCAVRAAPRMQTVTGGSGSSGAARQTPAGAANETAAVTLEQYLTFADSAYLDGSDIKEGGRGVDGVDAVYYLKQPGMLVEFEAELRRKGLPDDYIVRTDESAFESVIGPVESLNNLSLTFLIIVLVLGAIIMALLSAIAIRERKYEIGVLRAMGMKKKHVAIVLWIEIIAIACICFTFGIFAGTALSQPVSDSMLTWQEQTSASAVQSTSLADRMNGPGDSGGEEETAKIDISVSGSTALEIFIITILLASVAGIILVSRITKSEPIKILMERN